MNRIDDGLKSNDIRTVAFRMTIIVGIISHGYIFFNKLSYHDDMSCMFSLGATYGLGRWGLGLIEDLLVSSIGLYSAPVFIGSISIIFIGMSAALVCDILKVKSKKGGMYIGAIMAAFPVVASIFAFMFTAGIYFSALFLSVLSVHILSEKINIKRCLLAAMLIAICIGIYQAFLASSVTLIVMVLIIHVIDYPGRKFYVHFREALAYAATVFGGIGIYFVINKMCLKWKGTDLSSYQGINGSYNIYALPEKIVDIYHSFLGGGYEGINNQHLLSHSVKLIIVLTLMGIFVCICKKANEKICKFWLIFLLMMFPIATYLVKLFSTEENFHVHTLMVYSLVYVYVLPVCILERIPNRKDMLHGIIEGGKYILATVLLMLVLVYAYYDNVAYLKMSFVQEQTISYFNTLITQIKSVEGYNDEYPIVLLGYRNIEDKSFFSSKKLSEITFAGYEYEQKDLVNDYANLKYLEYYLGYEPDVLYVNASEYWGLVEVKEMSCYPDSGSIKVIDETIVVKFSENIEKQ